MYACIHCIDLLGSMQLRSNLVLLLANKLLAVIVAPLGGVKESYVRSLRKRKYQAPNLEVGSSTFASINMSIIDNF